MKRFICFITIFLVLCIATVSLARYNDWSISGDRPDNEMQLSGALSPSQIIDGTLPANNLHERERQTSTPETEALQSSEILLVNPDNPLPENFQPETLVNLYSQTDRHFQLANADTQICESVFAAMDEMFASAEADGVRGFIITSGYRSHEKQKEVFATSAEGIAANPGESEHETGLAFDVTAMGNDNFELTLQFEWLSKHCAEYGFIIRYPKGMEDITGFPYEPWHYRYVGAPYAQEIMDAGITLEDYLEQ